jgi:hypothetical protein
MKVSFLMIVCLSIFFLVTRVLVLAQKDLAQKSKV